jgi:predicted metal-dependent TIM-barrel fold hydrolase
MIRACGFHAGLWLSDLGGGTDRGISEAVRLVRSLGPEGLVMGSGAGLGGDLLGVARAADRLQKAGLSEAVARRVCGGNAVAWLGVDLEARRARRG